MDKKLIRNLIAYVVVAVCVGGARADPPQFPDYSTVTAVNLGTGNGMTFSDQGMSFSVLNTMHAYPEGTVLIQLTAPNQEALISYKGSGAKGCFVIKEFRGDPRRGAPSLGSAKLSVGTSLKNYKFYFNSESVTAGETTIWLLFSWEPSTWSYGVFYSNIITFEIGRTEGSSSSVTLAFDPNGGSVSPTSRTYPTSGCYNDHGGFPAPTKGGYTFDGWYTATYGGEQIGELWRVQPDVTIAYAHWSLAGAQKNKITFNANGGSCYVVSRYFTVGDYYGKNGSLPVPTWKNHTFFGWYSDQSLETLVWDDSIVAADVTTLYAKWQSDDEQKVTVTFNSNGGSSCSAQQYTVGGTYGTLPTPTKSGHTFDGWYTTSSLTTKVTASSMVAASVTTLYAKWTANTQYVMVSFEPNGGSACSAQQYTVGGTYGTLPSPTKADCTFGGWYSDQSLGARVYTSTTVSSSVTTLYAKWISNADGPILTIENGVLKRVNLNGYTDIVVPSSVERISDYVFYCKEVEFVSLPEGLRRIDEGAFWGCYKLHTLNLPSSLTEIKRSAFPYCSSLKRVVIPSGVSVIEDDAFEGCTALSELIIENGVLEIDAAFGGCTALTSVVIPSSVTSISGLAFNNCSGLKYAYVPMKLSSLFPNSGFCGSSARKIFYKDSLIALEYNGGEVDGLYVPCEYGVALGTLPMPKKSGCVFAGWYSNTALTELVTSETKGSSSLTKLYAKWTVDAQYVTVSFASNGGSSCGSQQYTIGGTYGTLPTPTKTGYTFDGWYTASFLATKVTASSTVSSSVTTLYAKWMAKTYTVTLDRQSGSGGTSSVTATYGSAMPSITVPSRSGYTFGGYYTSTGGSGTQYYTASGASSRTWDKTSGTTLYAKWQSNANSPIFTIEEGVLKSVSLNGCKEVTIPDGVTSIGNNVFYGCTGLTSVTIPDSVTNIGSSVFQRCYNLKNVNIPNSVTVIGDHAFWGTGLTSVIIPDGVISVGEEAFAVCNSLTNIAMPDRVISIIWDNRVFAGCRKLDSFSIPDNITNIRDGEFYDCSGLTSVTIPNGVTNIGNSAFYGCSGLTSMVIPDGVTSIGEKAFYGCRGLTSVIIPSGVTNIGEEVFYDCSGLTSVWISASVTDIGRYAFSSCSKLARVTMPKRFEGNLPEGIFDGCPSDLVVTYSDIDGCMLEFAANGGSVARASYMVPVGEVIGELPVPTRSGYKFLGWFTLASGGVRVTSETIVEKDITLYAHWVAAWTVKFNANGGTVAESSRMVQKGKAVGTLPKPTRSGYTFKGWYTKKSGGSKVSTKTKVKKSVTYYARWKAKKYAVTLKKTGKGTVSGGGKKAYKSKITLKAKASKGYVFRGWYDANGNKVSSKATWKTKVPLGGATYTAKFEKKSSTKAVKASVNSTGGMTRTGQSPSLPVGTPLLRKGTLADGNGAFTLIVDGNGSFLAVESNGGRIATECEILCEGDGEIVVVTADGAVFRLAVE